MTYTTETLDKMFLEWSQFTQARTEREIHFEKLSVDLQFKLEQSYRKIERLTNELQKLKSGS